MHSLAGRKHLSFRQGSLKCNKGPLNKKLKMKEKNHPIHRRKKKSALLAKAAESVSTLSSSKDSRFRSYLTESN